MPSPICITRQQELARKVLSFPDGHRLVEYKELLFPVCGAVVTNVMRVLTEWHTYGEEGEVDRITVGSAEGSP